MPSNTCQLASRPRTLNTTASCHRAAPDMLLANARAAHPSEGVIPLSQVNVSCLYALWHAGCDPNALPLHARQKMVNIEDLPAQTGSSRDGSQASIYQASGINFSPLLTCCHARAGKQPCVVMHAHATCAPNAPELHSAAAHPQARQHCCAVHFRRKHEACAGLGRAHTDLLARAAAQHQLGTWQL